jgi:hypothetical protein
MAIALLAPGPTVAQTPRQAHPAPPRAQFTTPESIHHEHRELHETLVRATREPGDLGVAAKALAAVLDPHFKREEEIATPPLSLLAPLSKGPATAEMRKVLPMTDALEKELPQMLAEHRRIMAARERFEAAARKAGREDYVRLSEALAVHARTEEEVLYPAAILVGRYVKQQAPR